MHCIRPKNCHGSLYEVVVGETMMTEAYALQNCEDNIGRTITYRDDEPHVLQGELSLLFVLIEFLFSLDDDSA